MKCVVFTLWVVYTFIKFSGALPPNLLYDIDVSGEVVHTLQSGSDVSSQEVVLNVPIVFFGIPFDTLYVNSNGLISFQTDIQQFINIAFPLDYPIIAPFYTHIDTTKGGGYVKFYQTDKPGLLSRATNMVQDSFSNAKDFQATSLFVVTWYRVGYYKEGEDKLNTFQIAISSDSQQSFVEFLYPENGLNWIQGTADESGLPDARAQAGIISPDAKLFTLPGSGTEQVQNLERWTNMGLPGQFIFKVDQSEIQEPDQYNEESKSTTPHSCSEAGTYCHIHATCKDYEEGFCCQCKDKFYGNGRNCIRKDLPLRVNGKVNGHINGERLDNLDLQSYIVMTDGRAYTAISKIPEGIGSDIQSLQILGGVIGYIFAKPLRTAVNGYQLTGGVFNHSATITFLNTSQVIKIKQKFTGLDVFDQLRLETDIRGEIPNLPNDVKVSIDEYHEEYSLTNPGVLQMSSTRNFKYTNALNNEEIVYVYTVEQSITFDYCKFENTSVGEVWKLKVGKNFISYESTEQIIRFGLSNKIVPFGDADPCEEGRSKCGPNSSCVVENDSYRCICNPGYQEFVRDGGVLCADVNECLSGLHDCDYNAQCINTIGSFTCTCNPGFEGNGQFCENARSCSGVQCPENSECVESNEVAQCRCQEGFTGDGQHCTAIVSQSCHINNNCSPNGYCTINPNTNNYYCVCLPNFEGNGYDCRPKPVTTTEVNYEVNTSYEHKEIQRCLMGVCWCPQGYTQELGTKYCILSNGEQETTTTIPENIESCEGTCHKDAQCILDEVNQRRVCECNPGYEGDGYHCEVERISCNIIDNCDPHATCVYSEEDGRAACICNEGYVGDGITCYSAGGRCGGVECTSTEECKVNSELQIYECVCRENHIRDSQHQCVPSEATCGGGKCVENAECVFDDHINTMFCACKPGYIGDGIRECKPKPIGCDVANNCGENAVCEYDHETTVYTCRCKDGYLGDGFLCYKEKTCQIDPSMCDPHASCIPDIYRFVCKCNSGYLGNGTVCRPIPSFSGNFLLLNYGIATLKLGTEPLHKPQGRPIQIQPNQISVGLDIDCLEGRVYWTDLSNRAIRSSTFDGSGKQDFINTALGSPEGLAIDWVSRNIYWTDSTNDTIEVANLDTKRRRTLFDTDLINPRGIAVHPQRGKIFWSDWNRQRPKIEWANADGTGREIFLQGFDVSLPNSLTIDYDNDNLCYADAGTKKIECVNIDTRRKYTIAVNCTYPFGIATTDKYYFWSDWISKKVERVDKHSLQRVPPIEVQRFGSGKLYGLVAVPKKCPQLTNVCEYYKDQCPPEHICLPNGSGSRSCVCSYRSDKLDEHPTCNL